MAARKLVAIAKYVPQKNNQKSFSKEIPVSEPVSAAESSFFRKNLERYYITFQRFEEFLKKEFVPDFENFLLLPVNKKHEVVKNFMDRYGFKEVIVSIRNFEFSLNGQKIIVHNDGFSENEIFFAGMESVFVRLEGEIL